MDLNTLTTENSQQENLLKEIRKLKQENASLKTKNKELERKEVSYAQKLIRFKNNPTDLINSNDKDIEQITQNYKEKSQDYHSQLLSITDRLNQFINDKTNFYNYKDEAEMYLKQYNEMEMKYNELKQQYEQLLNKKYNQLCEVVCERISLFGEKRIENECHIIQSHSNKNQSFGFNQEELKTRIEMNQSFKNEIMFEIKELIAKTNKNSFGSEQTIPRSRTISTYGQKENNESNRRFSEKFGVLLKPFESFGVDINKVKDTKVNNNIIQKPPNDLLYYIDMWYDVDFLNKTISQNYKTDNETHKLISIKQNIIPISIVSSLPINEYYYFIIDLINFINNSKHIQQPNITQTLTQPVNNSLCNCINFMFANINSINPIAIIASTSPLKASNILISLLSNLLFCVIGLLTETSITFLNEIIKTHSNKSIIVIHNLSHFSNVHDVEYYIKYYLIPYLKHYEHSTVKKCFMYSVNEAKSHHNTNTNCWYISQHITMNKEIIHLIYISNTNHSEAASWYNPSTIYYLHKTITNKGTVCNTNTFNIINTFNETTFPKEIQTPTYYDVEYSYCVRNKTLHIEIGVCGLVDNLELEIDNDRQLLTITGSRVIRQKFINDISNMNSNRKNGMFKVNCMLSENEMKMITFTKKSISLEEGVLYIKIK